ncbi:MAG: UDP-glucose 4-epimerase GalE, partial [Planctomycetota bacterium]
MTDQSRGPVLVTGGAGYIGSHTCKILRQRGRDVVIIDDLRIGHRAAALGAPLIQCNLTDQDQVRQVIEEHRPEAVVHFAAYAYVGESVSDPEKYYVNNVVGTLCLLSEMRRASIDRLVFSSTCATYGVPQQVPIPETHPQAPINPYGMTKLMVERILNDFDAAYGLRSISLRYFNAAGADPDGELGEDHAPETHLLPLLCQVALGQRDQIDIYGTDYDTPDGTCIRDYIHVVDLADAHLAALGALDRIEGCEAVNVGTGTGSSVLEVVAAASAAVGE